MQKTKINQEQVVKHDRKTRIFLFIGAAPSISLQQIHLSIAQHADLLFVVARFIAIEIYIQLLYLHSTQNSVHSLTSSLTYNLSK